jgi:hypothetical protein
MGVSAMSPARTRKRTTKRAQTKKKPAAKAKQTGSQSTAKSRKLDESELVLAWFRLLARRRAAWLQNLWSAEGSFDGRGAVTHIELVRTLEDDDSPEAEAEWGSQQPQVVEWREEQAQLEAQLKSFPDSKFARIAQLFGLSDYELDLLRLSFAVALDPSLGRVCAYLHDDSAQTYLTEDLANRLLNLPRAALWPVQLNVFRWELIIRTENGPGEPRALQCDAQIKERLLRANTLHPALVESTVLLDTPGPVLPEWPIENTAGWLNDSLQQERSLPVRVIIAAPSGAGKQNFASAVAAKMGLPILAVNTEGVDERAWPEMFLRVQRQAFLDAAAPVWSGDLPQRQSWASGLNLFPVQFVLTQSSEEQRQLATAIDLKISLPMPEAETREQLWKHGSKQSARWSEKKVRALAERHAAWPGDIERTLRLGVKTVEDATLKLRENARSRFGNLAQILDCPFTFDDLVLPDAVKQTLEAIIFEAEERESFWQEAEARRLFPQGRGLITMFSGPPGTGKTMAAQVVAAELEQDLCRVNVAQLVSKWVGETPKNCEQVIRVAAENNVVLFFDEADALFARRSTEIRDAQDKFANTDTAFLLQAIESFPGVAILATNLKGNIDPAFVRRLRYIVEFPKPDPVLQRALWGRLVEGLAGEERAEKLAPMLDHLSTSVEATGGQIKYAVLGGLFAARFDNKPLNAQHLLIGLDRELAKEGRGIGKRERLEILKEA